MKLRRIIAILMSLYITPSTHAVDGQVIADVVFKASATCTAISIFTGYCATKGLYLHTKKLLNFRKKPGYLRWADTKFKQDQPSDYAEIADMIMQREDLQGKIVPVEIWESRMARHCDSFALDSIECLFVFGSIAGAAKITSWWLSK